MFLWETELRLYIAPLLLLAGLLLVTVGCRRSFAAWRLPPRVATKGLDLMRGFRVAIAGLCLFGGAAGWLWQVKGLVVLAALIGAGEMMETSLDVWALRREVKARHR